MSFKLLSIKEIKEIDMCMEKELSKRIEFCDKGVTLDGYYFIAKGRINSASKLIKWLVHLMEKNWMDKDFTLYFIKRICFRYNIKQHSI